MTDEECVQKAYEEEIVQHVRDFVGLCISETPEAEDKFLSGLRIIRKARERAVELVK